MEGTIAEVFVVLDSDGYHPGSVLHSSVFLTRNEARKFAEWSATDRNEHIGLTKEDEGLYHVKVSSDKWAGSSVLEVRRYEISTCDNEIARFNARRKGH